MIQTRLLETAIDQFGRLGFEGASTREIARASDTAMSSITYHFGGKEGLYLAAADHIAKQVREILGPLRQKAEELAGSSTREQTIELLLAMLDGFAQMMLRPESEAWSRFIVREQQQPTEAFERLYQGAMKAMIETFVLLLREARTDLDDAECRATAILLFGQALVLRVGRASVCRALGVEALGEAEGTLLRTRLRKTALCILEEGNG
ncbi:MAG TPA: CerR family C-terminal domain-containing protein [Alteraurantiacibacter sp.]